MITQNNFSKYIVEERFLLETKINLLIEFLKDELYTIDQNLKEDEFNSLEEIYLFLLELFNNKFLYNVDVCQDTDITKTELIFYDSKDEFYLNFGIYAQTNYQYHLIDVSKLLSACGNKEDKKIIFLALKYLNFLGDHSERIQAELIAESVNEDDNRFDYLINADYPLYSYLRNTDLSLKDINRDIFSHEKFRDIYDCIAEEKFEDNISHRYVNMSSLSIYPFYDQYIIHYQLTENNNEHFIEQRLEQDISDIITLSIPFNVDEEFPDVNEIVKEMHQLNRIYEILYEYLMKL